MADNIIGLKSVHELLGMNFYIPDYQRGYRWSEQQVEDLLNDIKDFKSSNPQQFQFYCVQPLVVRKMFDNEISEKDLGEGTWYEVIDGQQRLTTIYLILRTLSLDKTQLYTIKYQRNNKIETFFNNIHLEKNDSYTNIDLYHIAKAYETIKDWIRSNENCMEDTRKSLTISDYENGRDKENNVRFIWYESVDENPIKVFTRLNIGKIALTNAELIKAMFLNRRNFEKQSDITLRQQEIASEWDRIEYQLQEKEFWFFLNNQKWDKPTKIDYIFNLMCDNNVLGLDENKLQYIGNDKYSVFRYFYEYFKLPGSSVVSCWEKVKKYFSTFKEWYDDVHFYHYIGFLVSQGHDVHALSKEWDNATTKTAFRNNLKERIKNIFKNIDISCGDEKSIIGKDKCRPILLFHNIQSVINRNVAQKENEKYKLAVFYKFPFHLYKLEKWDVEHINSYTTNPEEDTNTREEWLINIYLSVSYNDQQNIKSYFSKLTSSEEKNEIYTKIKTNLPSNDEWTDNTKNQIWNYTLLNSKINRGYGNAIFSAKRRIILAKEKGEKLEVPKITANGLVMEDSNKDTSYFVPPCTKDVFLKCYSPSVSENNYWTIYDAKCYLKDIERCVAQLNKA